MRYSIYYSAEADDYLVLNIKQRYVANHKNDSIPDILTNHNKYKRFPPWHDEGFWYPVCAAEGYGTLTDWLNDNYPDAVHILDFASLSKLKEQHIEYFI
jgi:hypothetical protein